MKKHNGMRAAGFTVGQKHRAQFVQQRVGRRQGIGCCTGRTDRGALATPGADLRVYFDVVAVWRDRSGRTEVEAAVATGQPRTRMDADLFGEIDVFRLVEAADKVTRL